MIGFIHEEYMPGDGCANVNDVTPPVLVVFGNRGGQVGQRACGVARLRHPRRGSSPALAMKNLN